ncbi:MAG: hypothetical protein IIW98_02275 [Bacteroidaceae bacterium]|nr:hypothetical protein [Bacteroidaceae bacterium]
MKRFILSAMLLMAAWMGARAMSFERAQAEAFYLTDKMAYELNLNEQQYNDAYEINFDYFLRVDSPSDLYGNYYTYHLHDLRCILHDWQYALFSAADYFLRPVIWRSSGWFFPVYSYYNRSHFYYARPHVCLSYRGGHGRIHFRDGFYAHRRPVWNGGLRGHDRHRPAVGHGGGHRPGAGGHNGGHRINGRGYHIDFNGQRGNDHRPNGGRPGSGMHSGTTRPSGDAVNRGIGSNRGSMNRGEGMRRGNSFDGSSSRMSGSVMRQSPARSNQMVTRPSHSNANRSGNISGFRGSSRGGGISGGGNRGGGGGRSGRR